MSVQWYVLRGEQSEGPFTSSELKLLADQRQITPDTLVKQGLSGPWMPAGTIEGLFVEYHGAKPAPSTGSPPPVRYVKPREPKRPVLAVPPTLAHPAAEAELAGTSPTPTEAVAMPTEGAPGRAMGQPVSASGQPTGVEPSRPTQAALQEPTPAGSQYGYPPSGIPTPGPTEDLLSPIWYLRTPDGQQYGPVSKQQLDQWVAEGRVGNDCWVWRAGWADWQGAGSVYGQLGHPLAAAAGSGAPATPASLATPAKPAETTGPHGRAAPAEPARLAGLSAPSAPTATAPSQAAKGPLEATAELAVDSQQWIGQTVGHYQLLQYIGRGPSGLVYKARHVALDRLVAVRLIPTGGDRRLFDQLSLGLRAAARLSHPHLVEVQDMGDAGQMVYVAMELMEGGSLADWIRRAGRIPPPVAMGIFHQVALALAAVHTAGLLHRDIKPSNILFTGQGVAKLSDLGLAALTEARLRAGPAALGSTAYYLAPEIFQGQPATVRSDLYSLGASFYHALCGHAPGEATPIEELVRRRGDVSVPPIGSVVAGLPPALAAMIDRLLLKDPSFRLASAKEVLEMFERMGAVAGGAGAKGPVPTPSGLPTGKAAGGIPVPAAGTPGAVGPPAVAGGPAGFGAMAVPGGGVAPGVASGPSPTEEPASWWTKATAFLRSLSWKGWALLGGAAILLLLLLLLLVSLLRGAPEVPPSEPESGSSAPAETPPNPPSGSSS